MPQRIVVRLSNSAQYTHHNCMHKIFALGSRLTLIDVCMMADNHLVKLFLMFFIRKEIYFGSGTLAIYRLTRV